MYSGTPQRLACRSLVVVGMRRPRDELYQALIRRGADLPLLLIFVGVIGGLLGFGLIGIFVGPVVLAVTYTLTQSWVDETPPQEVKD